MSCLLMGGQACVLYGAAEFSRDTDFAILADSENLARLRDALDELQAERIAVPPFDPKYLELGLAIHFRCHHPDARHMRIDIMAKMRGVDDFPILWDRRTTLDAGGDNIELLSLPDLVQCKKTQRDKDWPMIVRLLEVNYFSNRETPTREQIRFWLRELRSPSLLVEAAFAFASDCRQMAADRPLLSFAIAKDEAALDHALREEERKEREADRVYWLPLKEELQRLRHAERRSSGE